MHSYEHPSRISLLNPRKRLRMEYVSAALWNCFAANKCNKYVKNLEWKYLTSLYASGSEADFFLLAQLQIEESCSKCSTQQEKDDDCDSETSCSAHPRGAPARRHLWKGIKIGYISYLNDEILLKFTLSQEQSPCFYEFCMGLVQKHDQKKLEKSLNWHFLTAKHLKDHVLNCRNMFSDI